MNSATSISLQLDFVTLAVESRRHIIYPFSVYAENAAVSRARMSSIGSVVKRFCPHASQSNM